MTLILVSAGFRHLETLEEFSLRFSHLPACTNDDFKKILICHATSPTDIDFFKITNELSYQNAFDTFMKRIDSKNEEVQSKATSIFRQIYSHFNIRLTSYIVNNSYLFYNWDWNSIEIITNQDFVFHKISKLENKDLFCNDYIKKNHDVTLKSNISNDAVVSENKNKCDEVLKNLVFFKAIKKFSQDIKPLKIRLKKTSSLLQETFNLKKILYDDKIRTRWPNTHVLSLNNVDKLVAYIAALNVKCSEKLEVILLQQNNSWDLYKIFLSSFLKNHLKVEKNNGYERILKKHLKVCKNETDSHLPKILPITQTIVSSYILDILRRVLPREFYGNNNIKKKFFSFIVKVIDGQLDESFTWEPLLKIFIANKKKIFWCQDLKTEELQNLIILKTFKFILIHFIFLIIKSHFYVTETGASRYGLRFYSKIDVEKATHRVFKHLIHLKRIRLFKKRDADIFTIERHWLDTGVINEEDLTRKSEVLMSADVEFKQPIAAVRFLPKSDLNSGEMRIITSFPNRKPKFAKACEEIIRLEEKFKIRLTLRKRKLFLIKLFLEFLIERTCLGLKPVPQNPKLEEAWRTAMAMKKKFGQLHFVKADITNAFDSILHDKLLQVLKERIQEALGKEEYIQLKKISEWRVVNGKLKKTFRLSFAHQPKQNAVLSDRSDLIGDDNQKIKYKIVDFINIIQQVAFEQRIKIKNRVFKLSKGLAQGSAGRFSPHLCEIYYSSMDKIYFKAYLNSDNCILLRGVDDYLLITSDFNKAKEFLNIIRSGIKCFNATFNGQKLKTNLRGDVSEVGYLGLIFDFDAMSVRPDYSKYENKNLLCTMKLSDKWESVHLKKIDFFRNKIMRISTLKLQRILLNDYNGGNVIKETVFQACVMQSLRVMTLADYLFRKNEKNVLILVKVLIRSCRKFKNLIKNVSQISEFEVIWLFFEAVLVTFKRKSGQFKILLRFIRFCQRNFETFFQQTGGCFRDLRKIVDNQMKANGFITAVLGKNRRQIVMG